MSPTESGSIAALPSANLLTTDPNGENKVKNKNEPPSMKQMKNDNTNELSEAITGLLLLNVNKHSNTIEEALAENAKLMPVGESSKQDLVKEMDETQTQKQNDDKDTHSSEDTEPYTESDENQDPNWNKEPKLPRDSWSQENMDLSKKTPINGNIHVLSVES